METLIYNIPVAKLDAYPEKALIVRSYTSSEIVTTLSEEMFERLSYIQLLSLEIHGEELAHWGAGIPIELLMQHPEQEFSRLYRFSRLLETHPVRISIPVLPGFSKAVKLSVSLNLAVKLRIEQPEAPLFEELAHTLDFYLHHSTASQPVDFFHSLLLALYHQESVTLWTIQEEDPVYNRYITEQGEETISTRFEGIERGEQIASFVERFSRGLLDEHKECDGCEFFDYCAGYFKWPNREFSCEGIKQLFHVLEMAGRELRESLHAFQEAKETE